MARGRSLEESLDVIDAAWRADADALIGFSSGGACAFGGQRARPQDDHCRRAAADRLRTSALLDELDAIAAGRNDKLVLRDERSKSLTRANTRGRTGPKGCRAAREDVDV